MQRTSKSALRWCMMHERMYEHLFTDYMWRITLLRPQFHGLKVKCKIQAVTQGQRDATRSASVALGVILWIAKLLRQVGVNIHRKQWQCSNCILVPYQTSIRVQSWNTCLKARRRQMWGFLHDMSARNQPLPVNRE